MSDVKPLPESFHMKIHSGMLETMGHNMYSSIAKCLAEFVANSYDADAERVDIKMDFDAIDKAKKEVRSKARADKKKGLRKDISAIYDPLPNLITITIKDNGHGMSPQEIQDYFMAVTRNRREDKTTGLQTNVTTESGSRRVMGRKGVGKLAGFGAAEHIKLTSKRAGQDFATTFEMDYGNFKGSEDITTPKFPAQYTQNMDKDIQFTKITLSQLRCDSLKPSKDTITKSLSRTFSVLDEGFKVYLNDEKIVEEKIDWEFTYPKTLNNNGMGVATVKLNTDIDSDDNGNDESGESKFDIEYLIRFRARPDDQDSTPEKKQQRSSLPAERRGARIYCHGRIAHGPSLLKLHSGVHNFHAQDYMECIVKADKLDEYDFDCIVTSREGLHNDNPVVDALFSTVTDLMKKALAEHYKFRDNLIVEAIDTDPFSKGILSPLQSHSNKSRNAAKKILKVIGQEHGVKSDTYREMAPILLQAVNSSDVISRLIELEIDPKSLPVLAHSMAELTRMETNDLLKLYRARSKAINALQKLHEDSLDARKGEGYENELHSLLKEQTWLVRPEFNSYITSDKSMGNLCQTLNKILDIDRDLTKKENEKKYNEDSKRPDLVFLAANQPSPDSVIIVELKSPGISLNTDHLNQLTQYMFKTEEYLIAKLNKPVSVQGYLIGSVPDPKTSVDKQRHLLNLISKQTPNTEYKVIDLLELINTAKVVHQSGIKALEAEEKRLDEELN